MESQEYESVSKPRQFLCGFLRIALVMTLLSFSIVTEDGFSMEMSQFAQLRDQITAGILSFEPEEMRMLGYGTGGQLKDWSPEAITQEVRFGRESIKRLEAYDEQLSEQERVDRVVLVAHLRYLDYFYSQYNGALGNLQISVFPWDAIQYEWQQYETGTKDDLSARDRITAIEGILRGLPGHLRQQEQNLLAGMKLRSPDRGILLRVIGRIGSPNDENSIRGGLQLLAKQLASVSAIKPLQERAIRFLVEQAGLAYAAHVDFLKHAILPKAQEAWALGEVEYRRRLSLIYDYEGSLEDLVKPAERDLYRLKKQMIALAHELNPGHIENDTLLRDVLRDLRLQHASTMDELLNAYRSAQSGIDTALTTILGLPVGAATYEAAPPGVPVSSATNWPAPLLSDGQPIVLVGTLIDNPLLDVLFLAAHEGNPGHAAQSRFFQDNFHHNTAALCRFLGVPDEIGYVRGDWYAMLNIEGWALFVERLLLESKGLSRAQRLAGLTWQALRAARVVVDVKMHTAGWSRQRAAEYLESEAGQSSEAAQVEAFRYSRIPLQALSYHLGAREFEKLHQNYARSLGEHFYPEVLSLGPVPPTLIEQYIERSKLSNRMYQHSLAIQ